MAVEIRIPTINGLTLNTKNKYVKDDIAITIGIKRYDYTTDKEVSYEIDGLINGTLTEIYNDRVTSIRANAFSGCTSLVKANFPNVTSIGTSSFSGCTSLTEINFPNLLTISNTGFSGCSSLVKVVFPKLTQTATQGFNGCKNLEVVDLWVVTNFRGYSFQGCSNLKAIIIRTPDVVAKTDSNIFYSAGFSGIIYVPDDLVEQYKVATNWSAWADQIKPLSELEVE